MHVIGLAIDTSAGAAYRAELPMRALGEQGHRTEFIAWDQRDEPPPFEELRRADVVHMWRLFRGPARRLTTALREAGVGVVFDNDDDMTRVPKGSPAYREMKPAREQIAKELGSMLRLTDMVTTTCGELAGRLRRLGGGDVRVVENYVEPSFLRERRGNGDEVVIGWVAGMEHRGDLKDLRLRRALQQLLDAHPHVRLECVGVDAGVRSDRYVHRPSAHFQELPDVISGWDVGLAPIANVSFNRVRSNIKVKEYAAAGVPWLASPIGPYRDLGPQQGGRLVADFRWLEELTDIVTDTQARAELTEQAAAWGRTQTVTYNAAEWEAVFAEVAERAGRSVAVSVSRGGGAAESAPAAASGGARRPVTPRPDPVASQPAPERRRGLFRRRSR